MNWHWKQLERRTIFESSHLNVYEDTVELPNGEVIHDYTLTEKPSAVMIVASTSQGEIIVLDEYKYAVDQVLRTIPAGHIEKGEDVIETARRELLEETGFEAEDWKLAGEVYEYPTKDLHKVYVATASNARKTSTPCHEITEGIAAIELLSSDKLDMEIKEGKWRSSTILAAFRLLGL